MQNDQKYKDYYNLLKLFSYGTYLDFICKKND
jgi:hypothetical protein